MLLGTYPLGTAPLGSALDLSEEEAGFAGAPIQLMIGGEDLTAYLQEETVRGELALNMRGTLSFSLVDLTGNLHVDLGKEVRLLVEGICVFAGQLDSWKETVAVNGVAIYVYVECVDFSCILDRHVTNTFFDVPGQTVRDVVTAIVNSYSGDLGECVIDEGITYTASSIQEGPTLDRLVFKNERVSDALNTICELVGYSWWVDANKILFVQDSSTNWAPESLDEAKWSRWRDLSLSASRENYRNLQIIEGGQTTTAPVGDELARIETFVGDGEEKTFTVALPLADKPKIWIGESEVDPDDIAIREHDADALWFYEIDSNEISQNTSDEYEAVGDGITLTIEYQGYYPVIQRARLDAEIANRVAIEGGAGIYVNVEFDDTIDDADLAESKATALLRRHGVMPKSLPFSTTRHGFRPGQLIPVNLPEHNVEADYLIETVSFSFLAPDAEQPLTYQVSAISGESWGSWSQFFIEQRNKGRPFTSSENERIRDARDFVDKLELSETVTIDDGDELESWTVDRHTIYHLGMSRIGRRRNDADGDIRAGAVAGPKLSLPEYMT